LLRRYWRSGLMHDLARPLAQLPELASVALTEQRGQGSLLGRETVELGQPMAAGRPHVQPSSSSPPARSPAAAWLRGTLPRSGSEPTASPVSAARALAARRSRPKSEPSAGLRPHVVGGKPTATPMQPIPASTAAGLLRKALSARRRTPSQGFFFIIHAPPSLRHPSSLPA